MPLKPGAAVKGSSQDELVILSLEHPGRAPRPRFWILILLVFVAAGGFAAGWVGSYRLLDSLQTERDQLLRDLSRNEQTITELTQHVGILEKGGEVDRYAADSVRGSIRSLEQQVDDLERDVAFYKSIMDPDAVEKGLKIHGLVFDSLGESRYRYQLMLTQVADNGNPVAGTATVNVVGKNSQGARQTVPLNQLDSGFTGRFRFRYFQELSGELVLPDGFVPQTVNVVAQPTGKKSRRVEQTYDWTL
ncbi:DUF6776 family protein [Oceanobacter sp. 3_MG-2023]|uniref:DUF6776 family protein n=1 Tax=Oceanobacter sp. 3_MG-2023 TaxID=3062622 RepID=UPI0027359BAE|nr:DUF6776 family protein [Oceanobacter sp. 3_MG-2023]MDP2504732.1 hypothetical protein [Oceanobacter sp. 3_MG-2023]